MRKGCCLPNGPFGLSNAPELLFYCIFCWNVGILRYFVLSMSFDGNSRLATGPAASKLWHSRIVGWVRKGCCSPNGPFGLSNIPELLFSFMVVFFGWTGMPSFAKQLLSFAALYLLEYCTFNVNWDMSSYHFGCGEYSCGVSLAWFWRFYVKNGNWKCWSNGDIYPFADKGIT